MSVSLKSSVVGLSLLSLLVPSVRAGVGESAVITLVFPPGARATGLGEAFTGLSNDVNATYFNPAGLGQPPMANTWHVYLQDQGYTLTSIAAREKKAFELREEVWAGTNKGVLRYNGRAWEDFETHLIEEGDDLDMIIERFFGATDDKEWQQAAKLTLKRTNEIDAKREKKLRTLFAEHLGDSGKAAAQTERLTRQILLLDDLDRNAAKVYGIIATEVDSAKANEMADGIEEILAADDLDLEDLVELRIPFSIAVDDSVTALVIDESNQVWVGTEQGLWRYDGSSWKTFTVLEGLPSNNITAIAVGGYGSVAVGTDRGLVVYAQGLWKTYEGLPDSLISALTYGENERLYVGTRNGLAQRKDSAWVVYDTADGLLAQQVTALHVDDDKNLWIGGPGGVTMYNEVVWKRYKFPESTVHCIREYRKGRVWIGTDRGVIRYRPRRPRTDKEGNVVERPPEWKAFHSKNGLTGDNVRGIAIHGRDVWLATDIAVNHYDNAERQAMSFYEPLLPAFGIRDLWHLYFAGAWPTEDWGTIGLIVNYINMGVNQWFDELGRELGEARSWEGVFGVSYGLALRKDFSLGLNIKYVNSALAPGIGTGSEGIGRTFAIDASLLKRNLFLRGFDVGFMAQNMGPSIFYINAEDDDPIPFTLRLGLAYRAIETPVHDLAIVLDAYREFVKNYTDKSPDPFYKALFTSVTDNRWQEEVQEVQLSLGMEYWYVQFLALRLGCLFDYIGERYELTFGLGLRYGSLNFDWSYIHAPEGMLKQFLENFDETKTGATGARHGQWRVSFITRF
ncbi:MAG: PorV/PorQ family protein [Chitinivibrionales bacterium]|nr:PorV/PorQ family protein [Chitinivibrionales bacterium]